MVFCKDLAPSITLPKPKIQRLFLLTDNLEVLMICKDLAPSIALPKPKIQRLFLLRDILEGYPSSLDSRDPDTPFPGENPASVS